MSSSRSRRLFLAILATPILFLFFLFVASRRSISDLFSTNLPPPNLPDEIFGLLHFVTSPDEAGRIITAVGDQAPDGDGNGVQLGGAVAPEKPVAMAWYARGSIAKAVRGASSTGAAGDWHERLDSLRENYPLVVFSKSYCPYSKRAKNLLETYELSPAPRIIEVDWRADASHIKTILTRLTRHSTFPNAVLHGHSLGGSDNLIRLHEEDQLRHMLEAAGIKVGQTGRGVILS